MLRQPANRIDLSLNLHIASIGQFLAQGINVGDTCRRCIEEIVAIAHLGSGVLRDKVVLRPEEELIICA